MFCTNCGKQIDDDSNYCSFCGKEVNRSPIATEVREQEKSEPKVYFLKPPQQIQETTPVVEEVEEVSNIAEKRDVNSKYDESYQKDTMPTAVGMLMAFFWLILYFTNINKQHQFYQEYEQALRTQDLVTTFTLILRIAVTIWVVNIARFRNREPWSWGLFAFFLPAVALIFIGLQKKLKPKLKA